MSEMRYCPQCRGYRPPVHDHPATLFDIPSTFAPNAAAMNRDDSPTGRVDEGMATAAVDAAVKVDAKGMRRLVAQMIAESWPAGLTSREIADRLPKTRAGRTQDAHVAASRLQELWELGKVAVIRRNGQCKLGHCHPHDKPTIIHRPQDRCKLHGDTVKRDGSALWTLAGTRMMDK